MPVREIYLDNSATTRVDDEVAKAVYDTMVQNYGNPSSLHRKGLEAELAVREARGRVAAALGAQPEEIVFTSGGTEANNLALLGSMQMGRRMGGRVVVTAFEHSSVLASCAQLEKLGCEVVYVKPDGQGHISAKEVLAAVNEKTVLVSTMLVNNEVGTITPVAEIARGLRHKNKNALYHCDAVQAFGKLPIRVKRLDVDMLTVSGHKIYGPKGVGALFLRQGVRIQPRTFGGSQERGMRTGTESAPLIVGLGAAAARMDPAHTDIRCRAMRTALLRGAAEIPGLRINSPEDALPAVVNLSVPGIRSETLMHYLEQRGIFVSSGSACAKGEKSHVLRSMGLPDSLIDSALRVSFGQYNVPEEIPPFLDALRQAMRDLRRAK